MAKRVLLNVSEELWETAGSDEALATRFQQSYVLDLVRQGEVSAGRGAELLNMYLGDFLDLMAEHQIPYFTEPPEDPEELARRLSKAGQ